MTTARLELDETAIITAVAELRDDANPIDYVLLGYEDKSKIVLKAQGSGGLQELRETLDEDSVAYCLFRFMAGDQESKRVKFIFLTYIGQNVGGMAKGRSAGHKGDVRGLLGQSHLQINADGDRDEFTQEEVASKVKKASGANYDLGSNTGDDGDATYATQAGAIGKAAADTYKQLEKETTIAPVKYETFARPKETPMDLAGRPMVASASEGMKNVVIRDEENRDK